MRRKSSSGIMIPLALMLLSCVQVPEPGENRIFDVQAHRGGRDLLPENTLSAFRNAIMIGVDTLELDLALTRDGVPVASHDPYLTSKLVKDKNGVFLSPDEKILIKNLSLAELKEYTVGEINPSSSYHRLHRTQVSVEDEKIPSLSEIIGLMKEPQAAGIRLNIEIKTYPEFPEYTEDYRIITERVLDLLGEHQVYDRITIQSFDWRVLKLVKDINPNIQIACLASKNLKFEGTSFNLFPGKPGPSPWLNGLDYDDFSDIPSLVKTFGGDIVSPYYRDINRRDVEKAHELGLKIIPWTVNDPIVMNRIIEWGIDGLITDRPDILLEIIGSRRNPNSNSSQSQP